MFCGAALLLGVGSGDRGESEPYDRPLGVHLSSAGGEILEFSFEGVIGFVGDVWTGETALRSGDVGAGEMALRSGDGDGEDGDSGRLKGEVRGDLKERGDGLYGEDIVL